MSESGNDTERVTSRVAFLSPDGMESTQLCSSCHLVLKDPHIECSECSEQVTLCLECFSKGKELGLHENGHGYKVIKKQFTVLDKEWSAEEEMLLVDAIIHRGHGNWQDISADLVTKSPRQCEEHFEKVYIEDEDDLFLESWRSSAPRISRCDQPVDPVPSLEAPPRPTPLMSAYKDLAGYDAVRGDFEFELDNGFERELNHVQFANVRHAAEELETRPSLEQIIPSKSDVASSRDKRSEDASSLNKLECHLQLAALDVYRNKISSRQRTKKVVRELGLLNKSKVKSRGKMYAGLQEAGTGYTLVYRLGRLLCSYDHDYLLESLNHDLDLRRRILYLQEYRRNGLAKFISTAFFSKLKVQREKNLKQVAGETVSDWIHAAQHQRPLQLVPHINTRRSAGPLYIAAALGYEKLSVKEKSLCSEVRVLPGQYLDIKKSLMDECLKFKGLRLADARKLISIDVNKTRRIYEFLVSQGLLVKP